MEEDVGKLKNVKIVEIIESEKFVFSVIEEFVKLNLFVKFKKIKFVVNKKDVKNKELKVLLDFKDEKLFCVGGWWGLL